MTVRTDGSTPSAFVIGGTGQIGSATVRALAEHGWQVCAASKSGKAVEGWPDEVRTVAVDRLDTAALAKALGDGVDVVVDCVAYRSEHAQQYHALADRIGSAVVISSVSVYQDDEGVEFGSPQARFPDLIGEDQDTVEPGAGTYSTEKRALEVELLALKERLPVTLLRAGAVHGVRSKSLREWYFIKRAMDHRPVRILAYGGRSVLHPIATENLAELIRAAADRPGSRVLNAGDPNPPTVMQISTAIDEILGVTSEPVPVEGAPPARNVGDTPWSTAQPLVMDMSAAARELGYQPVTGYLESLASTIDWAMDAVDGRDWREVFPGLANNYGPDNDFFAYASEDRWLAERRG